MSNIRVRRIEDARRIRSLWTESMKEQPDLNLNRRLKDVTSKAVERTPSGNYVHLSSFKSSKPSARWIRNALRGRLDQDITVGPNLLPEKKLKMPPTGPMPANMTDDIIRRLDHIIQLLSKDQTPSE